MITKFYNCRLIILTAILYFTSGCQSSIESVTQHHKTVNQKWLALANYAKSDIYQYNINVSAKMTANIINNEVLFLLKDFKLSTEESHDTINLLTPDFSNKYICIPFCIQLLEYINGVGIQESTLLTKYFDKHEFELFRFYGDLYILNDQLALLNNENNAQLANYLYYLSRAENTFTNLKEFIAFLNEKLSIQNYREFINDPQSSAKVIVTDYKTSIHASKLVQNNLYQSYMNEPNFELSSNSPESTWEENDSTSEATWEENDSTSEAKDWQRDNIDGKSWISVAKKIDLALANKNWLMLKRRPLAISNIVCSYKDNYFGMVEELLNDEVKVFVQGQAISYSDGFIENLPQGSLFVEITDLPFKPIIKSMYIPKADLAICSLN